MARGRSIGLTLGTGVGGVVVVDGRVLLGHDGTAGEIGHQTIDPEGPPCGCGNHGCLEAFARADRIAAACGTETAEAAIEAARAGDATALAGLERIGTYLGIGIANMIVVLSPDRVVIGGGIAAAGDLLLGPISVELARRVHDDVAHVRQGRHGRARDVGGRHRGGDPWGGGDRSATRRRGRIVNEPGHRPQYRRIEVALRERIAAMRPGDRLPSDSQLCGEFGVSRMTARNAMQRLADEGIVARHPGRGSFVAEPPAHRRANRLMTFTQEMPTPWPRAELAGPGALDPAVDGGRGRRSSASRSERPSSHLRRLRCADAEPIALETAILVAAGAES